MSLGYSIATRHYRHDEPTVKLDLNEYDGQLHAGVKEAMQACVSNDTSSARYAMPHDRLTRNLVAHLARRHGVCAENILVTAGSDAALEYIVQAFGSRPVHIVMPAYQYFLQLCSHKKVTASRLCESFRPRRGSLVYWANPNNPTGMPTEVGADDASCIYVEDQAYAEFATDDHTLSILPNKLYTRTFSKAFGLAGLRIGYAVGPERLINAMRAIYNEKQVTTIAKVAALATLQNIGHYNQWIAHVREARSDLRRFVEQQLGLCCFESRANFVCMDVGPRAKAAALVEALERARVLVRLRDDLPGHVRISIGSAANMRALKTALAKFFGPRDDEVAEPRDG